MATIDLGRELSERAERLNVPGAAVGVYLNGEEHYAFHGVTSVDNPLPVDETTLFQFGSTGKTYTATAILRLVEDGKVDLDAPVRTYVPELRLRDADVAEKVTVLQLLNHTAGWDGDYNKNTGEGDDALARYVEGMAHINQVNSLGSVVSYNNASLSLAGRVIEKVTGKTYEQALNDLILAPLGLENTLFFPYDIMTRRFVVGHREQPDGTITVMRPWGMPRGGSPAGGISSTTADQIAWARFHLADGVAKDGTRVLPAERIRSMREPTVECPGSALGDAIGISWILRDEDGVRIVEHGGDTIGQHSEFLMVPERDFAVTVLTNSDGGGPRLNSQMVKWALEAYLGVTEPEPEVIVAEPAKLAEYTGTYETIAVIVEVTAGEGQLVVKPTIKPETLAELGEEPPPESTIDIGLLSADNDRYVITGDTGKGMKGYFTRSDDGRVNGVHIGGRYAERVDTPAGAAHGG